MITQRQKELDRVRLLEPGFVYLGTFKRGIGVNLVQNDGKKYVLKTKGDISDYLASDLRLHRITEIRALTEAEKSGIEDVPRLVQDYGELEGVRTFLREFVPGSCLEDLSIQEKEGLRIEAVNRLVSTLKAFHRAGIAIGDSKEGNYILSSNQEKVIPIDLDFAVFKANVDFEDWVKKDIDFLNRLQSTYNLLSNL